MADAQHPMGRLAQASQSIHYVSDKWQAYFPVYECLLAVYADQAIALLEVGVQNGGSLEVWAKYFQAASKIIGCDIDSKCGQLRFEDPRVSIVIGDIKRAEIQQKIYSQAECFDIVIDDGSHTSRDIVETFQALYAKLTPGGIYVVEDLHCSYWNKWQGGLWRANTAMEFFKDLTDMLNFQSWGVNFPKGKKISRTRVKRHSRFDPLQYRDIASIAFYNSMCVISKGHEPNSIGPRVVAGKEALVHTALPPNGSEFPKRKEPRNAKRLRLRG